MSDNDMITIVLAGVMLRSSAQDPEVTNNTNYNYNCTVYERQQRILGTCEDLPIGESSNTDVLLSALQDMCRNKERTRKCMERELGVCEKWTEINKMIDTHFMFCKNDTLPEVLVEALSGNKTVSHSCTRFLVQEVTCQHRTRMQGSESLPPTAADMYGYFEDYVNCFLGNENIDQIVDACGSMTRRQVYVVMVASLPLAWGLGIDYLPLIERLVPVPVPEAETTLQDLQNMFNK